MAGESLPDGWSWMTIEQLANPMGARPIVSGPFGSNISSKFFVDVGVPVIRGSNLKTDMTRFVDAGFAFVTEEKATELGNVDAIAGDLIFTAAGTLGQVGIITKECKYSKYIISNKQLRARLNPELIDPLYAYYWLSSPEMVRHIQQQNIGSSVPLINLSVVKRLTIPVAPLETQRAVLSILGALDDKIELNRRMNATLESLARAIFKSWFVDFDPIDDEAPSDWLSTTLGEFIAEHGGDIQTGPFGSQLHASDYVDEGVPVVMPKQLKQDRVSTDGIARIREEDAERLAKHRLQVGDIVQSRRGDVERLALVTPREEGWFCGTGCIRTRVNQQTVAPDYLLQYMSLPSVRQWIVMHALGSTMPNLNTKIIASLPFSLPPNHLEDPRLLSISEATMKQANNYAESLTLSTLRDTLLPKLLSGELPVPAALTAVEKARS